MAENPVIYYTDKLFHLPAPAFALPADYAELYFGIVLVYLAAGLLVAFYPFFFVIKKWQPLTWWKWAGAIIATFFLHFFVIAWPVNDSVGVWLERYVQNADWITQYLDFIYLLGVFVSLALSLSPFLAVWLIYHKYTWKRFVAALAAVLLTLGLNLLYWYWSLMTGFQMLIERFN